jgi:hypothetical protein
MFQNAFIWNVAINIYGGRDDLVWKYYSEHISIEYTRKLPYKFINYFNLFICFIKQIEHLIDELIETTCIGTIRQNREINASAVKDDMEKVMYYSFYHILPKCFMRQINKLK